MQKNTKWIFLATGIVGCCIILMLLMNYKQEVKEEADYAALVKERYLEESLEKYQIKEQFDNGEENRSDFYNRLLDRYSSDEDFAEVYGGAYIDSDGVMHVMFTEVTDEIKAQTELIAGRDKYIIVKARFTYAEILNVIDFINLKLSQLLEKYNKDELNTNEKILFDAKPASTLRGNLNRVEISMISSNEYDLELLTTLFKEYICDSEILYFTEQRTIQYHLCSTSWEPSR